MPFKRAAWLQRCGSIENADPGWFQCPLSGLLGCNDQPRDEESDRAGFNAL